MSGRIKKYRILFAACMSFLFAVPFCLADRDTMDIIASVIVLPTFKIDVDNTYLDFGLVEPGQSVTLKEGAYYNRVRCISNKGINYSVKVIMRGDIVGPRGTAIPPSQLKCRVYRSSGSGTAMTNWQEFLNEPVLIYTASLEDRTGDEVVLELQYRLDLPADAPGGHYILRVAYTLTEEG